MSERLGGSKSNQQVESIGAYLAAQRRVRGISAEQLADITRIPLRSIERLEAGHFDAVRDGFARGFVRTVAVALGLDPAETVNRTRPEPSAEKFAGLGERPVWRRVAVLIVLAALLIGAGVFVRESVRGFSRPPPTGSDYVYRRDPVRDLAQAQGSLPSPEPAVHGVKRESPRVEEPEPQRQGKDFAQRADLGL